jgi:hypothetical protein
MADEGISDLETGLRNKYWGKSVPKNEPSIILFGIMIAPVTERKKYVEVEITSHPFIGFCFMDHFPGLRCIGCIHPKFRFRYWDYCRGDHLRGAHANRSIRHSCHQFGVCNIHFYSGISHKHTNTDFVTNTHLHAYTACAADQRISRDELPGGTR